MLAEEILSELNKSIAPGKRNNTLFAIGSQLKEAELENWDEVLYNRAIQVGLDSTEASKIIENINRYA
ncbi:MAG: hypothetical protein LBH13_00410 [Cellulomonadaceae bacterium]|jgi:hypothetical protein|nr:hypothetical protein [Cellulomonadaceae bacterium]